MKNILLTLAIFAAACILLIPADAGAVLQMPVTGTFTYDASVDPSPQYVALSEFNTALGTLTGINIDASANIAAEVQLFNFTGAPVPFTNAESQGPFQLTEPGGSVIGSATLDTGYINGTAAAGPFVPSTFSGPMTGYDWKAAISPSSFGYYEGSGTASFVLTYGPGSAVATSAPGTLAVGADQMGSGTITLTYDYIPSNAVPEPCAVIPIGFGLACAALFRKKSTAI